MEVSRGSKIIHLIIKIITLIKILRLNKVTSHILIKKSLHLTKEMIMKNNLEINKE